MILKNINTIYVTQHRVMENTACSASLVFLLNEITKLTDQVSRVNSIFRGLFKLGMQLLCKPEYKFVQVCFQLIFVSVCFSDTQFNCTECIVMRIINRIQILVSNCYQKDCHSPWIHEQRKYLLDMDHLFYQFIFSSTKIILEAV